ncbi:glycosyltransferase [Neorhizobium sp. IRS_2294]|uniref:glycosyltransferase n=1 Tax=unclassified Neorhizobium TaxID=2629175 RepID=UPI003D26AA43
MLIRKTLIKLGLLRQATSEATSLVKKADDANRNRNWAVAQNYYVEALKHLPYHDGLWVQYGHCLKEGGDFAGAESAYRTALEHNSKSADTYLQLGHVLKLQGSVLAAVEMYEHALNVDPEFEPAKIELQKPEIHIVLAQRNSFDDVIVGLTAHFDADYYYGRNPDVKSAGVDALQHYCSSGWREHRDPTDWFSTGYYLSTFADVRNSGINPFLHYIKFGKDEGRFPREHVDERLGLLASLQDEVRPAAPQYRDAPSNHKLLDDAVALSTKSYGSGIVLSLSHTCYIEVVAGTELVVGKEQLLFNTRDYGYVHISPCESSDFIFDTALEETRFKVVVDGALVGIFSGDQIAECMKRYKAAARRVFVVHSPLGHSLPAMTGLNEAFSATENYYWLHDYSSLCKGYNLLRNQVEFCGAPPLDSIACSVCIFGDERARRVAQINALFAQIPFVVLSPSEAALNIWVKSFNGRRHGEEVVPHSELSPTNEPKDERAPHLPIRIAFVGYPVEHKGWRIFKEVVAANRFNMNYEFLHFVSQSFNHHHDRYVTRVHAEVKAGSETSMVELIRQNNIDLVIMPSGWPETFSFVTYEAIAAGCTILTLKNSGNVASIIRKMERGVVFDNPRDLVDFFSDGLALDYVKSGAAMKRNFELSFVGTTSSSKHFAEASIA